MPDPNTVNIRASAAAGSAKMRQWQSTPTSDHPPALAEPDRAEPGIGLDQILRALRRRLRLIAAVTVAGTGLAAVAGHFVVPVYTATASVLIDRTDSRLADVMEAGPDARPDPGAVQTQVALITSRSQIERVMADLGLADDPEFRPLGTANGTSLMPLVPKPLEFVARYVPEHWLVAVGAATETVARLESTEDGITAIPKGATDRFAQKLEVDQIGASMAINISFTSLDAAKAARVANGVANGYVAAQVEAKRDAARRASGWLQERLTDIQQQVRSAEQAAAEFRALHGLSSTSDANLGDERLNDLHRQLVEIRAAEIEKEAELRRARGTPEGGKEANAQALAEVLNSPLILQLREQIAALLRDKADLVKTYGSRHPKMTGLDAQVGELRAEIARETDRIVANLASELEVLQSRELAIAQDVAEVEKSNAVDRRAEAQLRQLESEATASRQLYESLLHRLKGTQEQERTMAAEARVISRADPPAWPTTPPLSVFALLGFTVSLTFGGLLALLAEQLERRVRSAADVEHALGMPVLALLPRLPRRRKRTPGRYILERPFSAYAEALRSTLASLDTDKRGAAATVVLITSGLPAEGKSTLSISLAASAAASGLKVLLFDADLRRPTIGRRLGLDAGGVGLTDYLGGRCSREQLIQRDTVTNVDVITVGRPPANPAGVLKSAELRNLIEACRCHYQLIILDSSPVLTVVDPKLAARLADRVIFAVRWFQSDVEGITHAVRALAGAQVEFAGCVLTVVNMRRYKLFGRDAGRYYAQYKSYYHE